MDNPPQPEIIEDEFEFEVDEILDYRLFRGKIPQYLVHWKGYSYDKNTWEPVEHLANASTLLDEFNAKRGLEFSGRKSPLKGDNVIDNNTLKKKPKTRRRSKTHS